MKLFLYRAAYAIAFVMAWAVMGEDAGGPVAVDEVIGDEKMNSNCEYVSRYYDVPACIGRGVVIEGKPGVITEDRGAYIGVVLDGEPATNVRPYHPAWKIEYGEMREVPKLTRSQKRYRDYLNADCGLTFLEYLKGYR